MSLTRLLLQPEQDFRAEGKARVVDAGAIYPDKDYVFGDYSERLWAYLTVQQLLENRFHAQLVNDLHWQTASSPFFG